MEIMHFNSQRERIAYLRGGYEEIIPVIAKDEPEKAKETPKKAKKKAKKSKKEDENGEI